MSTGIITTALILIIGYAVLSRIVGFAFRLVVPVVLIVILGGAGVFSGLMSDTAPERYASSRDAFGDPAQQRASGDIGDLSLRELADMAIGTARSLLQGSLALLDRALEPERAPEPMPYRPVEPRRHRYGEDRDASFPRDRDWAPRERQERW